MLSFHVSGSPGFVFLNPLSLATDDCRSVLAVKGSLRRFAPWTAAGRSGRRGCLRGKGGGRVDGQKGNLSVIPAALSRSRGALSPVGP